MVESERENVWSPTLSRRRKQWKGKKRPYFSKGGGGRPPIKTPLEDSSNRIQCGKVTPSDQEERGSRRSAKKHKCEKTARVFGKAGRRREKKNLKAKMWALARI